MTNEIPLKKVKVKLTDDYCKDCFTEINIKKKNMASRQCL